ncbi:MAG: hypothetical protein JSS29_16260 [Proteobacteria bacterium]|nr:hypothetical protein [Pseudomonadota bacterium]
MNRALRRSARPFVVFAVLLGAVSAVGFYNYFTHDRRPDLLQAAVGPIVLYVAILALISSVSISVSDKGLNIVRWYVMKQFIPFSQIEHSEVQILAEPDWPVRITIYSANEVLARLSLKAVRQADAAWLCSLPELKCNAQG